MRVAILSSGSGWHVRDLQRAACALNHEAVLVDFRRVQAAVPAGDGLLEDFHGIIVRTMLPGSLEQVVFRMDALAQLERAGVAVLNPPKAIEICVDKYLTTARLCAAGLAVPATIACQNADDAMEGFKKLGGDVVVKPLFGSEGRGMLRIADPDLAWRTFQVLGRVQSVLYLQQFVVSSGWDLRIFVMGGEVVAGMRRFAKNDWRANVAQGGTAERFSPDSRQAGLALRAAEVVGAPVAGVDLLPGKDGQWYVLEVNAVPGWRALTSVTGEDIAVRMLEYLTQWRTNRK
jgi:ribosomal protein S6--L-glutamate ligase